MTDSIPISHPRDMTMIESRPTPTLSARIASVMADIRTVPKRGENKFAHYHYATADDVYDALRPILAKHGLTVWQKIHGIREFEHKGVAFLIMDVATGLDGEDPDTILPTPVPLNTAGTKGVRLDAQAIQAALTYAQKYYLRSRFLLATGDPDADADAPQVVDASKQPEAKAKARQARTKRTAVEKISYTLDGVAIMGELGEVLTAHSPLADDWAKPQQTALYMLLHKNAQAAHDDVPLILAHNRDLIVRGIPYPGRIGLAGIWKHHPAVTPELLESITVPVGAEG